MKISALLEAVKQDLNADPSLAEARDVDVTPGRFNADEITRRSFKAPALRVAFLGAPRTKANADDSRRYEGAFAVFVLTDGKNRATAGIDLTEAVAVAIEANRFSDGQGIGLPSNLRIDALYGGDVDEKGISLHAVTWTQAVHLGQRQGLGGAPDADAIIPDEVEIDQTIDITQMPGVN